MRGPSARLAAACAFAVAMTAFTGSALAGTTQGKASAPPVTPPNATACAGDAGNAELAGGPHHQERQ
jgi:hypothetical protein